MARPKYSPKTDRNHAVVSAVVKDLGFRLGGLDLRTIDTSKVGGNLPDWLVYIGPLALMFEVKHPGEENRLTDGEAETLSWDIPFFIVTEEQEVVDILTDHIAAAWELVHILEDRPDGNKL